jgi:hypothetical protein
MNNKSVKIVCICFGLIIFSSFLASLLQSGFGKIRIKDIYFPTENQQYLHAMIFVPKSASADNKCPVVLTLHGWTSNLETQDSTSIELARRGIMVISLDGYSHGKSSNAPVHIAASEGQGHGFVPLIKYLKSGALDYVDTNRIGLTGHSMGGGSTINTLVNYGKQYDAAIEKAKMTDSDGGTSITAEEQAFADSQYPVSAALSVGYGPNLIKDDDWQYIRCNLGIIYGLYEEGGKSNSTGSANILGASKEALAMINPIDPSVGSVEGGKFYGNKGNGTLRVLYQPRITHPLEAISPSTVKLLIGYFTYVWDIKTPLNAGNQIYLIKEVFNLIALLALLALFVPLADIFMKIPCFAGLRGSPGPQIPYTARSKKIFVIGLLLNGVISFVTVLFTLFNFNNLFPAHIPVSTLLFGSTHMNAFIFWSFINMVWLFFWFWWNFKRDKKEGLRTDEMIGWKISIREFGKSVVFTSVIIGAVYVIVWFCKWLFNTDFRFWTVSLQTFPANKLVSYIQYLPIFFGFYLAQSLFVNGACRFEGMNERKNLILLGLGGSMGAGILCILQYGKILFTGMVMWGGGEWGIIVAVCTIIWQLFMAPFFLRGFYKLTGKNWLGPLAVSSLYVMSGVMNISLSIKWFTTI